MDKKKIFSSLVAGTMALSAMSISAFASTATGYTYQIGGQTTDKNSLTEVINEAQNGDTIKLLVNDKLSGPAVVPQGKEITLDLNGCTITNDTNFSGDDALIIVSYGATLTVTDSSENNTGAIKVTDNNKIYEAVKLTAKDEVYNETTGSANLIVNGGTLEGYYYGILGNGGRPNTNITINGGVVKANNTEDADDSAGIYHPQNGTLTLNGGTIEGGTGVYFKGGTLNIPATSAVVVKGTGKKEEYKANVSGFYSTGDAIVIDNCNGYTLTSVAINGGTFTSVNAEAVGSYAGVDNAALTSFISGGTFSSDVSALVADETPSIENDGTYTVGNYVCSIGDTNYQSLSAAVAAANSDDTVTLTKDATGAGVVISKNVTIDFGGHTYTVNKGVGSSNTETNAFQVLANSNDKDEDGKYKPYDVTFKNGTIKLAAPENTVTGTRVTTGIMNYSNLTLTDITIDATERRDLYIILSTNNGTCTLNGTTNFKGENYGESGHKKENEAILDVDGRTTRPTYGMSKIIINTTGEIPGKVTCYGGNAIVDIQNGKFTGNEFSVADKAKVGISGGTFKTDVSAYTTVDVAMTEDNGTYTVGEEIWQVGETKYKSLAAAIEAVDATNGVELLKNATGAGAAIEKSVTVDFGGYIYTANKGYGSPDTETNAIWVNASKKDVTLKNGTIKLNGNSYKNDKGETKYLKTVVKNNANLTLDNLVLDATGVEKLYIVLSTNGRNTTKLTGNTSLWGTNSGNSWIGGTPGNTNNYWEAILDISGATVEVATTGKIQGLVKVYGSGSLDVNNADFTGTVVKYGDATINNFGNKNFYLAENTTVGEYTDDNGGAATAVTSVINPNGKTVSSIAWKYGEKSASATTPAISGNSSVVYGIIIPETVQYTETITVDVK